MPRPKEISMTYPDEHVATSSSKSGEKFNLCSNRHDKVTGGSSPELGRGNPKLRFKLTLFIELHDTKDKGAFCVLSHTKVAYPVTLPWFQRIDGLRV
jgi:hypothetical protein